MTIISATYSYAAADVRLNKLDDYVATKLVKQSDRETLIAATDTIDKTIAQDQRANGSPLSAEEIKGRTAGLINGLEQEGKLTRAQAVQLCRILVYDVMDNMAAGQQEARDHLEKRIDQMISNHMGRAENKEILLAASDAATAQFGDWADSQIKVSDEEAADKQKQIVDTICREYGLDAKQTKELKYLLIPGSKNPTEVKDCPTRNKSEIEALDALIARGRATPADKKAVLDALDTINQGLIDWGGQLPAGSEPSAQLRDREGDRIAQGLISGGKLTKNQARLLSLFIGPSSSAQHSGGREAGLDPSWSTASSGTDLLELFRTLLANTQDHRVANYAANGHRGHMHQSHNLIVDSKV